MSNIHNPKTGQSLKDAIVDLYLNVKIRSSEEVLLYASGCLPLLNTPERRYVLALQRKEGECMSAERQIASFSEEKYKQEKERLTTVDQFTVLDYIRSTVEILMNLKAENENAPNPSSHSARSEESLPEPPKLPLQLPSAHSCPLLLCEFIGERIQSLAIKDLSFPRLEHYSAIDIIQ